MNNTTDKSTKINETNKINETKTDDTDDKTLGIVGVVGRFKPLHIGAALMLDTLCQKSEYVKIGIGSTNKYNARNPFTPEETRDMIDLYLKPRFSNYEIFFIPDFAHISGNSDGIPWKNYVLQTYGTLDNFVSGNPYVASLLKSNYNIIHPADVIHISKQFRMSGTMVRMAMATGNDYKQMVPPSVAEYLDKNKLVQRFRNEFGLVTLESLSEDSWSGSEDIYKEKNHTLEK